MTYETMSQCDEKLMKHLTNHCSKNPMDRLDDNDYIEKIESEANDFVNPYTICDDIDFNLLM